MRVSSKSIRVLFIAVLPAAAVLLASVAYAVSPAWMPGFPLRAGTNVILMWTPVPGATEYKLLKKTGEGDYKQVYKGPVNNFTDPDAPPAKTIEYKVIAISAGKEGKPSSVAMLKGIEPPKPPKITGTLPSANNIVLRWTNPPGSMFFNLYRAEKKGGPYTLLGSFQQDSYTDRKVKKGVSYYYQVAAVDKNNMESAKSEPAMGMLTEAAAKAVEEKPVIKKPIRIGEFVGEELYELTQPIDVGFDKNGELFVMDRTSIQFFDKDGTFKRRIDFNPKWGLPTSAIVDNDGKFLVASATDSIIRKVEDTGEAIEVKRYPVLKEIKRKNNPNGVAIDKEGNYWIADGNRWQVIKLSPAGKVLEIMGRPPGTFDAKTKTDSDLPGLNRIYFNPNDGKIYAILGISAKIKVIDPKTAKVIRTLGGIGSKNDNFSGIGGLAFLSNGNILVLDQLLQVVKEFTKDFKYVATYADETEQNKTKLSTNFISGFAFREDIKRAYIISSLGNKVYMFDFPL
jgi:hypothetical protein